MFERIQSSNFWIFSKLIFHLDFWKCQLINKLIKIRKILSFLRNLCVQLPWTAFESIYFLAFSSSRSSSIVQYIKRMMMLEKKLLNWITSFSLASICILLIFCNTTMIFSSKAFLNYDRLKMMNLWIHKETLFMIIIKFHVYDLVLWKKFFNCPFAHN